MNFSFQQKCTSLVQKEVSSNSQLYQPTCSYIFCHTQLSLSFILPLTDEAAAAGINVHSHCLGFLMSSTKTGVCFSFSRLLVVRTASCFLYHHCRLSTSLVSALFFSIVMLQCFLFHCCPTARLTVAHTETSDADVTLQLQLYLTNFK